MQSGSLRFFKRILFTEINYQRIYFCLIAKLTGLNSCVYNLDLPVQDINTYIFEDFGFKEVITNKFNATYVLIRNFNYKNDFNPKINNDLLAVKSPKMNDITIYKSSVKCVSIDFNISLIFRDYPVCFPISSKEILEEKIKILRELCTNSVEHNDIHMIKKIVTTEEIVQIRPYTKKMTREKLLKVPVVKSPVYKFMFPESVMKHFRESLAQSNKTRKTNVEISYIYDKFYLELFSSIKHDSSSKNLLCLFKDKSVALIKDENINKLCFLIAGQRRDTKATIRALAFIDSNMLIPKASE